MGGLKEGVVIGQFAHLPSGDISKFVAAIADIDTPQTGHCIQQFVAFAVGQGHALGTGDNAHAFCRQLVSGGERMHVVRGIQRLKLGRRQVVGDCGHKIDS